MALAPRDLAKALFPSQAPCRISSFQGVFSLHLPKFRHRALFLIKVIKKQNLNRLCFSATKGKAVLTLPLPICLLAHAEHFLLEVISLSNPAPSSQTDPGIGVVLMGSLLPENLKLKFTPESLEAIRVY
jgi:hypothetical protein